MVKALSVNEFYWICQAKISKNHIPFFVCFKKVQIISQGTGSSWNSSQDHKIKYPIYMSTRMSNIHVKTESTDIH